MVQGHQLSAHFIVYIAKIWSHARVGLKGFAVSVMAFNSLRPEDYGCHLAENIFKGAPNQRHLVVSLGLTELTLWSLENVAMTLFMDWCHEYFLENCPYANATGPHWWFYWLVLIREQAIASTSVNFSVGKCSRAHPQIILFVKCNFLCSYLHLKMMSSNWR